jgi:hypothetical protein
MTKHTTRSLTLAFIALLLWNGCTTSRVIENSRVPEIVIDDYGAITFNKERVELGRIASAVKAAGFTRTQEVNILVPDKPDRKIMSAVSSELVRSGYTRTVFVKNRKATAVVKKPN